MTVIADAAQAAAFCRRLSKSAFVAVDTEFMRESTYWPRLCLVQLAGEDEAAAIDPLAEGMELAPLFALMADEAVLKVFHAARQDLEIFAQLTGQVPRPVFDTQVAAMVCGLGDQIGYEAIARRLAGVAIDKDSRFTDWHRRPLTARQIAYALADVTHLRTVHERLAAMLAENGRGGWIDGEMAALTSLDTYRMEPGEAWRRIRTKARKPRQLAALRELAAWREETARRRDLPRNRVARDELLERIAIQRPASAAELQAIRLVPRGLAASRDGKAMLAAVGRAMALPEEALPRREAKEGAPNAPVALLELLKVLLRARCEREGVTPRLVASAADLERFAAATDGAAGPLASGWRHALFGRDALRLKRGQLALAPDGDGLKLIDLKPGQGAPGQ